MQKFKLEQGLDIIIIDYLQLMSGSGRGGDSRQQEISDISRALKRGSQRVKCSGGCAVTAEPCGGKTR